MTVSSTWIDLSHPLTDGMPSVPGLPTPKVNRLMELGRHHANVTSLNMHVHAGTHVDAPCHFLADGLSIDAIPVERFIGQGRVVHVPKAALEPITASDLEQAGGLLSRGQTLLLCTGFGSVFGQPTYLDHPFLTPDAVDWVVDRRVNALALDTLSPELPARLRAGDFSWPVHRCLLGEDILILENLNRCLQSLRGMVEVLFIPLRIVGSDASPVRVLVRTG